MVVFRIQYERAVSLPSMVPEPLQVLHKSELDYPSSCPPLLIAVLTFSLTLTASSGPHSAIPCPSLSSYAQSDYSAWGFCPHLLPAITSVLAHSTGQLYSP